MGLQNGGPGGRVAGVPPLPPCFETLAGKDCEAEDALVVSNDLELVDTKSSGVLIDGGPEGRSS